MNVQNITAILGLAAALIAAWEQFAASGQPVTVAAVIMVLCTGLVGWMAKRPGDVTKAQAETKAQERTTQALREVSATRRESMPDLDLPGDE